MNHVISKNADMATNPSSGVRLTPREQEVMKWVAIGKSAWETSRILGCTESGINFHLCNIRRKFQVNTLRAALVKAIEQGILMPH